MTWLYSIVIAGLMFSSHSGTVNPPLSSPSAVAAQSDRRQDETERIDKTFPFSPNGRVSVSNVNGSITVESWDQNEIRLEAVKTADSKETLSEVEIKIDARQDAFSVEADYGSWNNRQGGVWKNRRAEVQFHLWVPRGAVLDGVETVNGSVSVSNFTNVTNVSAVNGNVNATNLRGTAKLSTVNGEVIADFDRLETGTRINLETVNGRVNLTIPSDSNATLRADSVNGSIANDFGLPVRKGQYVGRDLYGRIGSGEVQVKLSSVNGPLSIGRKNDGKSPSPATNLLPQKSKDDEDWDDDSDESSNLDMQKVDRDVARQVRKSKQDVATKMRESQKELAKLKAMKVEMPPIEVPKVEIDTKAFKDAVAAIDDAKIKEQVKAATQAQLAMIPRMYEINRMRMPRVEKKSDSFPVKGIAAVVVDAPGCEVRVRGWDKPEVQYTVSQYTDSRSGAAFSSAESHSDSSVNIKVVNADPEARDGSFSNEMRRIRVDVYVPKKTNLKVVTNGEIRVEGVSGELQLNGGGEAINVRDADGTLRVTNTDGLVRVVGFRGGLEANTSDGDVYLEGDFDKVTGNAGDGSFYLTVPENANASIVSNTDIDPGSVPVKEAGDNRWQLGEGGRDYKFHFGGGSLILRRTCDIASM